jgi:hypothetical protein
VKESVARNVLGVGPRARIQKQPGNLDVFRPAMPRRLSLLPCHGRCPVVRPDNHGMQRRYAKVELAALEELEHGVATTRSRPIYRCPHGFYITQHA